MDGQPAEPWSYWWSLRWFECQRGLTLGYLAHISRYRTRAIEALATTYTDVTGSELAAGYLVHRAAIHARGGDVAEARADAFQVVPIWRQTNSTGLRGLLIQLRTDLAARYPGDARVKELAEALA